MSEANASWFLLPLARSGWIDHIEPTTSFPNPSSQTQWLLHSSSPLGEGCRSRTELWLLAQGVDSVIPLTSNVTFGKSPSHVDCPSLNLHLMTFILDGHSED